MPRYPGYRFANEFHRDGRPIDETIEASFLRVFRNEGEHYSPGCTRTPRPHPTTTGTTEHP